MPVELILLGVIAVIFSIIFFFLYLELSTRKRRLVQDIKIILKDLPSKLSERRRSEQSKLDIISRYLKSGREKEVEEEKAKNDVKEAILNEYRNKKKEKAEEEKEEKKDKDLEKYSMDEAYSIIGEVKTLKNKLGGLDALSIVELETIHAKIKKYYYRELPKSDVDIKSALSRVNSVLDHFIPMNRHKGNTSVRG